MALHLTITHWFPIITFCPVNKLPDFIFVKVTFNTFKELYAVRKELKKAFNFRCMFMEDVALEVAERFPDSEQVEVHLAFSKHIVKISKE